MAVRLMTAHVAITGAMIMREIIGCISARKNTTGNAII